MPPAALLELIRSTTDKPVIFAGDGALRYREIIVESVGQQAIIAPFQLHNSRSANGALLALDAYSRGEMLNPAQLLPVYLRGSDAEINRKPKQQAYPVVV
jgi:tRNA threonylcarbamoyladenosine biosynthesis protein TsaB